MSRRGPIRNIGNLGRGVIKKGGVAVSSDPFYGHTWPLYCRFIDASITRSGTAVEAITNQGTGADLTQSVAGNKPTFLADQYGAGLDAVSFDGADWLKSISDIDYGSPTTFTTVWAGTSNSAALRFLLFAGTTTVYIASGIRATTGVARNLHALGVGASARIGTTNLTSAPHYVIAYHDVTQTSGEVTTVRVDGTVEDGGTDGSDSNNTAGPGIMTTRIGIYPNESSFGFFGDTVFVGVAQGLITGDALTSLEADLSTWLGL